MKAIDRRRPLSCFNLSHGIHTFYLNGELRIKSAHDLLTVCSLSGNIEYLSASNIHKSERYVCSCDPIISPEMNNDLQARYDRQVLIDLPESSPTRIRRISNQLTPVLAVDQCIEAAIKELISQGIETTGCCCGHNMQPAWVSVHPDFYIKMFELGYVQKPVEMINGSPHGLYTFLL